MKSCCFALQRDAHLSRKIFKKNVHPVLRLLTVEAQKPTSLLDVSCHDSVMHHAGTYPYKAKQQRQPSHFSYHYYDCGVVASKMLISTYCYYCYCYCYYDNHYYYYYYCYYYCYYYYYKRVARLTTSQVQLPENDFFHQAARQGAPEHCKN